MSEIDNHFHVLAAQTHFPGMAYLEWLKWFHQFLNPLTYVEIGVESGQSLQFAQPPTRGIGIDPELKVVHSQKTWVKLFSMTSDNFFASYNLRQVIEHDAVDFAFIDGLHTFDQALKDFINIEKYSNKNTVVAFHDIYPVTPITAERERKTFFWLGDTWKVIPILRTYRPDLKIITIPTFPSGLAIVTNLDCESNSLQKIYKEVVNKFMEINLRDHLSEMGNLLNVIPNETAAVAKFLGEKWLLLTTDNSNTISYVSSPDISRVTKDFSSISVVEQDFSTINRYLEITSEIPGDIFIRNQIEIDFCQKFLKGHKILKINGQDQLLSCMSDEISDDSLDTLIGLNLITGAYEWVDVLSQLAKKVCPDGNIITNFYSLDHLEFFGVQSAQNLDIFKHAINYKQIIKAAEKLGLNLITAAPYGFADRNNRYRHPLDGNILTETDAWQRHISWLSVDKELFDFFCFLEKSLIQYMPTVATSRFFVVFQKATKKNQPIEVSNTLNINDGFNLGLLSSLLDCSEQEWKITINSYLKNKRNAVIFFLFWTSFWKNPEYFNYESFLEENHFRQLNLWWQQEILDQKTLTIARDWCLQDQIRQALTYDGINTGCCLEWYLIPELLRNHLHAFERRHP